MDFCNVLPESHGPTGATMQLNDVNLTFSDICCLCLARGVLVHSVRKWQLCSACIVIAQHLHVLSHLPGDLFWSGAKHSRPRQVIFDCLSKISCLGLVCFALPQNLHASRLCGLRAGLFGGQAFCQQDYPQ